VNWSRSSFLTSSLKQKLLETIASGRARESEFEALCVDAPADPSGRWRAKDHLAHLSWWRDRSASVVDAVRTGGDPPPRVEDEPQNATIYQANRDRPASEILADARGSWDRLAAAIEACTEADLVKPHPHGPGVPLLDNVPGSAGHLGIHLMFWYLDSGDEASAERAQLWSYEVESDPAFTNAKQRAYAAYDLACFYGRVGRAERALPLLRHSLEGAPELLELARGDTDLDQIRQDQELAALLGG
jgi:hypothetical protein